MYSFASDFQDDWLFHISVVRLMADSQRRNIFHSSLKHSILTLALELGSFCPSSQFDLLLRLNLSFQALACRLVDLIPACNFWKKLKQFAFERKVLLTNLGNGTGGKVPFVCIVIPPIDIVPCDIAPKVFIPLIVCKCGYPWKMADDGRVAATGSIP
jgi:hypothetical protein